MQLPLASSLAVVALLSPTSAATAEPIADAGFESLPPTSPCPAYEGPQCDSQAHERYVTGQDLVDLAGLPHLAA